MKEYSVIERDFPIHLDVVTGGDVFVFKGPWPRLLVRSLAYHHGQTLVLHEVEASPAYGLTGAVEVPRVLY